MTWMRFGKNRDIPSSQIRLCKHNDTNILKTHTQTFKKKSFLKDLICSKIQKKKETKEKPAQQNEVPRESGSAVAGVMFSVIPTAGSSPLSWQHPVTYELLVGNGHGQAGNPVPLC